jgi:uncharacterized protein (UPF0248 family)
MPGHPAEGTLAMMSAPAANVFRIHLADPGGRTSLLDVPTEDFEVSDRGITLGGNTVIPWHRVIRYTREATQEVDTAFRQHAEMRVWLDDGTDEGETIKVRSDRLEQGQWTVDLQIERALNVEAGIFHVTKIHVPWARVLEFERLPVPVGVPSRPD